MAINSTYAKAGAILFSQRIFNLFNPGLWKGLVILSFMLSGFTAYSQYMETFGTANKGYLVSCMSDFAGVNWTLSSWDPMGGCVALRDASDYFRTSAGGLLECIDLDQDVYWESPLINISAAGTVSLSVGLVWNGFDNDVMINTCSTTNSPVITLDFIKVMYSINGGAYTMFPNQVGGAACATIGYVNGAGNDINGSTTVTVPGLSGTNIKVRIVVGTNANLELVQIDNVSIPQAGVTLNCSQPVLTSTINNIVCNGPNSGSIDLGVSGGVPGYTYVWSNGPTTQDISGLAAGAYNVTVTDVASCSSTGSFVVSSTPLGQSGATTPAYCGGTNGSVDLTVTGGNPGYTYIWSNGGTTQDITAAAGSNSVTVTDSSVPACTSTASYNVSTIATGPYSETFSTPNRGYLINQVNNFLGVNWTLSPWTLDEPITGIGRDNGDAFATTAGGKLEGSDFDMEVCWDSPPISTAGAGTYQFSTDLAWTGMDEEDYIKVSYSINDAAYITLPNNGTGGVATIQYASPSVDINGSATVTASGLSGNKLEIRVCFLTNSQADVLSMDNVTIPQTVSLCFGPMISATTTNVLCNGASTGAINITVTGGTAPYTFNWGGGVMTEDRTGLAAGMYTVTVTDASMNSSTYSTTITQPPAIVLSETHVNVLCNGASTGSIDLTVSGGVPGYTYLWSNGATTQDLASRPAGTYTVTVTDANGCTKTNSATITQPLAIVLSTISVSTLCNGASTGSIDLTVFGGVPGYTYLWSNGATTQDLASRPAGTYVVTVTDANGCTNTKSTTITQPPAITLSMAPTNVPCFGGTNGAINLTPSGGIPSYTFLWSNGATTEDIVNLSGGTYTVTVTDAAGCTKTNSASVTVPPAIVSSGTVFNVACNGAATGIINLTPSGGVPGYTFAWSNGSTTEDIAMLTAGTYIVTITDVNNCTGTNSFMVTEPANGLLLSTVVTNPCPTMPNGVIDLSVSGGTPGYSYLWSNGTTTEDLMGIADGTYYVTVTDNNGCTNTTSATIITGGYVSISNGNYNDPASWLGGCVPPSTIPPGTTVTINHDIINDGIVCNNGTIISTGMFINNGMYKGSGTYTGNFTNNGTVSPGN